MSDVFNPGGAANGWLAHVFAPRPSGPAAALRGHIPAEALIVDAEAGDGQFAISAARIALRGRVFAFEPEPNARAAILRAVAAKGPRRVLVQPFALFDETAPHVRTDIPEDRLAGPSDGVVTLDHFVTSRGMKRLDFLRTSGANGFELRIIHGALASLQALKPTLLLGVQRLRLAMHGDHPEDVFELLGRLGYTGFRFGGEEPELAIQFMQDGDYLFVPRR